MTDDCFISEAISDIGEESDDDNETTMDWIDEKAHECYGDSSSASSNTGGVYSNQVFTFKTGQKH